MDRTTVTAVMLAMAVGAAAAGAEELGQLPLGPKPRAYELGSGGPGTFYDCAAGETVPFEAMVERMGKAQVVLLGEEHTHLPQKRLQARILDALADTGRPLVLGMEFFQRTDGDVLRRWVEGTLDGDAFLLASHWYDRGGYNWGYYADVMEVARRRGIPVAGLNVPRSILHTVSRKGLDALDEEQRRTVGPVTTGGSPEHRYLISRYFGDTVALLPPAWFDRMYAAQCVWDVVMARSILDALPEGGTVVAIAGTGHVAYGLGIARRIAEEAARRGVPAPSVVTLVTAQAPAATGDEPHGHPMGPDGGGKEEGFRPAVFSRGVADFVAVFPDDGGVEAFPSLGLSLETKDGAVTVRRVRPDSPAADAGLERGDVLLDIAGWRPPDVSRARLRLAGLRWGDRFDLAVLRGGAPRFCATLLEPELVETERSVAPGWSVRALPAFDPTAPVPEPVPPGSAEEPEVRYVLVERDGVPVRVEARAGEVLVAVHEIENGAVVRSLYRDPLPDGAVEVRYRRGPDGAVTAEERLDRAGVPVPR